MLVVDRLVNPKILDYARRDAERIFVGKTPGGPTTSQAEINRILVREASAGKVVARLKGGDPFIFGRAAEEMAALQTAGIGVEVVPGVTAAHACAARIGLPVTLRERVRHFSVVTGATADGAPDLDWQALAAPGTAFAVYMGVGNAPLLRCHLLAAGADPDTPVVIVENGTREDERAVATTLSDLTDCVAGQAIAGPAVIFVGLDWESAGLCRPETVIVHRRQSPARARIATATMSLPTPRPRYEQVRPANLRADRQPPGRRHRRVPRFRGRLEREHRRGRGRALARTRPERSRTAAPTTRRAISWSSPISSRCARPTATSPPSATASACASPAPASSTTCRATRSLSPLAGRGSG